MTQKCLWSGILIVALIPGLAVTARADFTPVKTIIVVASTTLAAAIAVVLVVSVHHRRKKIAITGCVLSGGEGMTITDEEDRKTYVVSGDTTGVKPGDRMTLQGKKVKAEGSGKTLEWKLNAVLKDLGACPS